MLNITTELRENASVLRPEGRLTLSTAPYLRESIVTQLNGDRLIVVDLSGTTFVDSSGLGALVSCLKSARQAGGDLRLVAPTEQVTMVLKLTNLESLFEPRASIEEALHD